MPEIDREKLKTKLDSIPEQDREPYLAALKGKGYTWSVSNQEKPSIYQSIKSAVAPAINIMTGDSGPSSSEDEKVAAMLMRRSLPGMIGQAGSAINEKAQKASGDIAEAGGRYASTHPKTGPAVNAAAIGAGTALGTASEASLPKGPISTLFQVAGMEGQKNPLSEKPSAPEYNVPTKSQRVIADIAGTQSGSNPKYLAAVIANPEIMGDATPSTAQVGAKYQDLFKRLGETVDRDAYKEITGMRYKPTDTQVSKLQGIVSQTMEKLDNGEEISAAEAFLARSAAKKAMMNRATADVAGLSRDAAALDNYLSEYKGIPELKDLGHEYFRASAKEDLSDILPKNKRGDPAVVRSLLMAHYGKEALSALAEGKAGKAAISAGTGAMMSPSVQGKIIPFIAGETNPMTRLAGVATLPNTPAAIQALLNRRQKDNDNGQ